MNINLNCEVFELNNYRSINFELIYRKYGLFIREIHPICFYNKDYYGFDRIDHDLMYCFYDPMDYPYRPIRAITGFNVKYSLSNFSTIFEKTIVAKRYIVFHEEDFFTTNEYFAIKPKLNLE